MKRYKTTSGLGKIVYTEWMIPLKDYYCSIRKNERTFEIIIPLIIALGCSISYVVIGKTFIALKALSGLLPTAISILIGFTIMLITLLLTIDSENIKTLKTTNTKNSLNGNPLSLFQNLHIQFVHSLLSEVLLLLIVFLFLFWYGLGMSLTISLCFLFFEVYFTLNILFSILRGITSIYFSFFKLKG